MYRTRFVVALLATLTVWCTVEAVLQIRFRVDHGMWYPTYARNRTYMHRMFKWHPYLASAGRPLAHVPGWTHDDLGFRNQVPLQTPPSRVRIVTLGGSSTYGTGVSDNATWPAQMGRELGDRYEVYNMGIPGYSTVENIIQMALVVPDLAPRIALFYEGWNDLHTMHVRDLKPDYSDYHGPGVVAANDVFGSSFPFQSWAITYDMAWRLAIKLTCHLSDVYPAVQPGAAALTPAIDQRALQLFERNLRTLIELSREQHITPVMVPQVLNVSNYRSRQPSSWERFVRPQDVPDALKAYNLAMRSVCQKDNVCFIESVMHYPWLQTDFVDQGHLSAEGSRKFAHLVCDYLRENRVGNYRY